jgi:hypothetical protein
MFPRLTPPTSSGETQIKHNTICTTCRHDQQQNTILINKCQICPTFFTMLTYLVFLLPEEGQTKKENCLVCLSVCLSVYLSHKQNRFLCD